MALSAGRLPYRTMNDRCESIRASLIGEPGRPAARSAVVRAHLACCEGCAGYARLLERLLAVPRVPAPPELDERVRFELSHAGRTVRLTRHLRGLERDAVPGALEGGVVGALHAGRRQDRVVEHLRAVRPVAAPAALDSAVARALEDAAEEAGLRAPRELDSRVAADLRASFRRRVGRLRRALGSGPTAAPIEAPNSPPRQRLSRGTLALAAAASLVAILLGWGLGLGPSGPGRSQTEPVALEVGRLRWERTGVDGLGDMGRQMLAGLSGGFSEVLPPSARAIPPARELATGSGPSGSTDGLPGADGPTQETTKPGRERALDLELSFGTTLLERLVDAPLDLRYSGRRRVRLADPSSGHEVVLLETVSSDGQGRFAVDPLEVVRAPADSEAHGAFFELMQKGREGFLFRYRDFRVRDLGGFMDNYVVRELDEMPVVAGRPCVLLDVRRQEQPERFYRAAVDPETGLVLRYEELLVGAEEAGPLTRVEFETLELGHDAQLGDLTGGPTAWVEFDPEGPLPAEIDFPLRAPDFIPAGYRLQRAATRTNARGEMWVEFLYGDGVEQIFFLHSGSAFGDDTTALPLGDRIRHAGVASWTVVDGEVQGVPVLAVGRLDPAELLLLLQSAFD